MTGRDVPDDEMPNFPLSQHPGPGPVPDEALDALLRGSRPLAAVPELQPVAELLGALTSAPEPAELAAQEQAMAVFRGQASLPVPFPGPGRHARRGWQSPLRSARAAAAFIAAAITLGGFATAAYAGALPAPAQRIAHTALGAPAPAASHTPGRHAAEPSSPDPNGPTSWHGLCTAYRHAVVHGSGPQQSAAFRRLAVAAGGRANIAAYCATVTHPGTSPPGQQASHQPSHRSSHPPGKASARADSHGKPSPSPTSSASATPSATPTATASSHGRGKGRPSTLPTSNSTDSSS
ncbi:MAG: hypothetical protein LBI49_12725 [Nocardiopsaceae bacterium]|jgi:hypothetical protein|nr:hypothetical protein [Nocardiopsaceae bacterium]